eukprot:CAMPEP_0172700950 /NCGR_PEP_ID=MMETSP1074-20121228/31279_1 /TAXON_ID=2916 /ORGANISM="Ceratium fusus, Strain PA161109" /LENGTH=32 /DNA_ID= /DNA_START= /DNA_END= /DNA_ORIENTATION=
MILKSSEMVSQPLHMAPFMPTQATPLVPTGCT